MTHFYTTIQFLSDLRIPFEVGKTEDMGTHRIIVYPNDKIEAVLGQKDTLAFFFHKDESLEFMRFWQEETVPKESQPNKGGSSTIYWD